MPKRQQKKPFSQAGRELIQHVVKYMLRKEDDEITRTGISIDQFEDDPDTVIVTVLTKVVSGSGTVGIESRLRTMIMDIAREEGEPGIKGIVFNLTPRQALAT